MPAGPVTAFLVDLVDPPFELWPLIGDQFEVTQLAMEGVAGQLEVGPGPHDIGHRVELVHQFGGALLLGGLLDVGLEAVDQVVMVGEQLVGQRGVSVLVKQALDEFHGLPGTVRLNVAMVICTHFKISSEIID